MSYEAMHFYWSETSLYDRTDYDLTHDDQKLATEKHPPRVSAHGGEAPHQTLSLFLTKTAFTFSMKFLKKG